MDALRSSFPGFPSFASASSAESSGVSRHKVVRVKVLVVGAGPVGLFAMHQLEGMQMLHNERLCTHKTSPSKRKVLVHDMTPDGHNANGAKMLSGQKFASLYDKETRSYEPCLEWHFNGSGFSACDTIYEAWQKGMKVIHLLPSKVKEEAVGVKNQPGKRGKHQLIQHLNHKRSGRHYTVAEAMACPEKYQVNLARFDLSEL
ncbi:hypothetical protein [Endozoicomonas sp. SESOKO1]|uniref:hypothetical protein n=1 Tax=Endozoicomonas sp. SESOKO1 TaxID=2828742 RepID=UPI002148E830|nr:hypothetical protein [Endozoicomonas sp. SESOKO1]